MGYEIKTVMPRPSTRFMQNYFLGKELVGVEIGVYRGRNSESLLNHLNIKKLYLIDPYISYGEYEEDSINNEEMGLLKFEAKNRLKKYSDKIEFIYLKSEQVSFLETKFDFVYIDGNHTEKYVKQDLEKYYPLVKQGGLIAGHDVDNVGVISAVVKFCEENNLKFDIKFPDWIILK